MRAPNQTLTVPPAGAVRGVYGDSTGTDGDVLARPTSHMTAAAVQLPSANWEYEQNRRRHPLIQLPHLEEDSMSVPTPGASSTPDRPNSEALSSIDSTLEHIKRLAERQKVLNAAQLEAEEQMLHRIGQEYDAGNLGIADLIDLYAAFREYALSGFTRRWNANVALAAQTISNTNLHAFRAPNGPDGSWEGFGRPGAKDPAPPRGIFVVYLLLDEGHLPCYLGSTGQFRPRIAQHVRDGKEFAMWRAWPCKSREDAYQREEQMLRDVMPYLNRRAGR